MLVKDGRERERLRGTCAFGADVRAHVDGVGGVAVGFDQDVGALARAQGDDVGFVRLDGHEVWCCRGRD